MNLRIQRRGLLAAAAASALARTGWAAEPIVVGQIGPFTGMPAPDAPELQQGISAAFAQINASGGIHGRQLNLFELDDGFKDDAFVRQFAEAMKRRPVALLAPVGTRSVRRMLDDKLLDREDVLVLNAIPGADSLRNPGHPRLFHVRAGDQQQIERIIQHAATLGISQMAVLVQDVPIGKSGLAAAKLAAAGLKMQLAAFDTRADASVLAQSAAQAVASQPQSALVLGSPRFAADAIAALRQAGFGRFVYALSYVPPTLVRQLAKGAARGVALAQVFPNPNGATLAVQQAFQAAMRRAGVNPPFTAFQFEGYITARVLADGLRRSREISASALAQALRSLGDLDLGGYRVNFAKDNLGSSFVDIAVINGEGRLVY